jgi:hypothetical protein
MRICDMREEDIKVGMKVRSLRDPSKIGIVTSIDATRDNLAWIQWEGEPIPYSGFYGNDCECEVVE